MTDPVLLIGIAVFLLVIFLLLRRIRRKPAQQLVIDGSNVMYWRNNTPDMDTIKDVLSCVKRHGYSAGIMFDANAGYLLTGKYLHDDALSRMLGLPQDRVMVVPKGTQADPAILLAARDLGARVVTNDKFRDWKDDYPEVRHDGFLIKGSYRSGKLELKI